MNNTVRQVRDFFVSLKLTVVLLALGILLIFAGTLAQVNLGIWAVQKQFFQSFIAIWHIGKLYVPIPGGYLVGGLLLINLIAAHIYRFQLTWKKAGIQLTHLGVILLLVGELLSGLWQETYTMRIVEGQTANYSEHERDFELAVVDTTDAKFDDVVAIPESLLADGRTVQHPKLPFRVVTKLHYPNAALARRTGQSSAPVVQNLATAGIGTQLETTSLPLTYKENERNIPAAFVELIGTGGSLGTWLVSPDLGAPQSFSHDGRTWKLALRQTRAYKPFAITLREVRHDVYPGTDIPKNFSSRVRLTTLDGSDDRDVLIYMNNPMRHGGYTFYQHQMDAGHRTTVLQAVRNPSWAIPYLACALMTLGLLWQFCFHLFGFVGKRHKLRPAAA
ncbi:MAG TPA: cytochrome c biogenesis protein ResB [Opitutaceae bacterium]|nr:cytochrome c biogenesis protein ResB [Opitutaceae bacterium]